MWKFHLLLFFYVDIVYTLLYDISMEGGKANEKETKEKACKVDYQSNNSNSPTD